MSSIKSSTEDVDIIICGCGPTGALLSALLSRLGVHHVILEKEMGITTDPRGIALDEDGIRALQSVGIYEAIFMEMGKPMGIFNFTEATNSDLSVKPFLKFDYNTIEGGTGHPGFLCHKQPTMEKHLRAAMSDEFGELRSGCEVISITEDEKSVSAEYLDVFGNTKSIRGKFLVAADGKTGFTRKRYLEPKGIVMERNPKADYEATWVAHNWKVTLPTTTTHPDFPLFKLGYTPSQIYDLFFPDNFYFICNPDRPSVCGRFGRNEDHLVRFEFVVKENEDAKTMASLTEANKMFFPYLTHPGRRYGLKGQVKWPDDCIECIRSSPFTFTARSCNRWSRNRVILTGDAAHVFPPFGGQGIASGFRDALSLSWRLKLAIQEGCNFCEELLKGWYTERKQQLERSLAATITNGNICTESSRVKTFLRNWYFRLVRMVPSWRHDLELGPRKDGMIAYQWEYGMPFLPQFCGGKSFPQVFSAPISGAAPGIPSFTDDGIFAAGKRGIFQLVVLLHKSDELGDAQQELQKFFSVFDAGVLEVKGSWSQGEDDTGKTQATLREQSKEDSFKLIHPEEATFIVHSLPSRIEAPRRPSSSEEFFSEEENVIRVVDAEEYESAGIAHNLSTGNAFPRPPPKFYDPNRIRKDLGFDKRFVVVRFDRVVYAACRTLDELEVALKSLKTSLHGDSG